MRLLKNLWIALLALLVVSIASVVGSGEAVKITAALSVNHKAVVEAFNAQRKDIQVEYLQIGTGPGAGWDKMLVEILAGAGPDIQFIDWYEYVDKFIDAGVFISLSPYFARDNMQSQLKDIPPVIVNRFSRNGELYGIPEYLHMRAVGINRQFREEAGLPLPSSNWRWDDYRAYAKKLTKKDSNDQVKVWGTTIAPYWSTVQGWLRGAGAKLTAPGNPSVIDIIKPEVIETFEFLAEIKREHRAYSSMGAGILGGTVAMQESMASNYAKNMHESIYDFDTVEHPLGPANARAIVVNDGSLFISKTAKNKDAAWEFLKFFFSREGQIIYMGTTGFQPARMSLVSDWKAIVQSKWPSIDDKWFVPFFNAYAYAEVTEYFTESQVVTQYLEPMCKQIINNGQPVLATLESVVPAANAFIADLKASKK